MSSLNRRSFLHLASLLAAAAALPLRAEQSAPILLPANVCGHFGFINSKGVLTVPARYDAVLPFATDYAAVHRHDKWGYINRTGKEVLPPQYEEARNFRWNCCPVRVGNQWHFIRPDGTDAFPARFDVARSFQDARGKGVGSIRTNEMP